MELQDFVTDEHIAQRSNVVSLPVGERGNKLKQLYHSFSVQHHRFDAEWRKQFFEAMYLSGFFLVAGIGTALPSVILIVLWWLIDVQYHVSWLSVVYACLFRTLYYITLVIIGRSIWYKARSRTNANWVVPIESPAGTLKQSIGPEWTYRWWQCTCNRTMAIAFVFVCLILDWAYSFYIHGFVSLIYIVAVNTPGSCGRKFIVTLCLCTILLPLVAVQYYFSMFLLMLNAWSSSTQIIFLSAILPISFLLHRSLALAWLDRASVVSDTTVMVVTNAVVCFESFVLRSLVRSVWSKLTLYSIVIQYAIIAVFSVLSTYGNGLYLHCCQRFHRSVSISTAVDQCAPDQRSRPAVVLISSRLFACVVAEKACIVVMAVFSCCSSLTLAANPQPLVYGVLLQCVLLVSLEALIGIILIVTHVRVYKLNIMSGLKKNACQLVTLLCLTVTFITRLHFNNLLFSELHFNAIPIQKFLQLWNIPDNDLGIMYSGKVGDEGLFFGLIRWLT
jgi:hypothetical protein